MNPDILRWINLIVCTLSLFPVGALILMIYRERELAPKRKLLNAILICLVGVMGMRAMVQIGMYACVILKLNPTLNTLNSGALFNNILTTIAVWLLWLYVHRIKKG